MRKSTLAVLAAATLALAACTRLNTPEEKAGYAVGLSIGKNLKGIADRVELSKVYAGYLEQAAGKATLDEAKMQETLMQLNPQGPPPADKKATGYAVGVSIGKNLKGVQDYIKSARVISGIKDELAGKPKMKEDEMRTVLTELSSRQGEKSKAEGLAYLEANKKKAGVVTTASGLQYEVIKAGTGPKPKLKNSVKVHYAGTLINGTEFDSSIKRGTPAEFGVGGVIKGWTEALQLMPVGSKWKLTIPSELAYGSQGAGGAIGPDSVLIFDVELLAIVK